MEPLAATGRSARPRRCPGACSRITPQPSQRAFSNFAMHVQQPPACRPRSCRSSMFLVTSSSSPRQAAASSRAEGRHAPAFRLHIRPSINPRRAGTHCRRPGRRRGSRLERLRRVGGRSSSRQRGLSRSPSASRKVSRPGFPWRFPGPGSGSRWRRGPGQLRTRVTAPVSALGPSSACHPGSARAGPAAGSVLPGRRRRRGAAAECSVSSVFGLGRAPAAWP